VNAFNGYPIIVNPDTHRTLAADVPVTPEFRAEIDAWMKTFFKPRNALADGEVQNLGGKLYMNPRTFEVVKREFSQ
jgi:hypothetical protein